MSPVVRASSMSSRCTSAGSTALRVLVLAVSVTLVLAACGGGPSPTVVPSSEDLGSASPGASIDGSASAVASASSGASASPTGAPTPTPVPTATAAPTATRAPTPTPAPTEPPALGAFPQSWSGTWADPVTGGSGSLELTLTGDRDDIGGTIAMDGTACLGSGVVRGSLGDDGITLSAIQRDVEIRFTGDASAASMTGSFRSDCDGMDGTWTVVRTD